MLKAIHRKLHEALNISYGKGGETAVVLVEKAADPPKWALKGSAVDDYEHVKAIWAYPTRSTYNRALVLKLDKEDDVFTSACTAISSLKSRKITDADVIFPRKFKQDQIIKWVNTAILKNYSYSAKTVKEGEEDSAETFVKDLYLNGEVPSGRKLQLSIKSALCALYGRDLANTRGSEATPLFLVNKAQEIYYSNQRKVTIEVMKGEELEKNGLKLLYNVGKAAVCPPHLVVLEYSGAHDYAEKINLVAKGVTFDTGGLNVKSTGSIEDMYLDKSGACTALSVFKWAVESNVNVNLICTLALAENAIGSKSYKPSDIITSLKGLTVEIGNTDAEGRLCLADAMTYTQNKYKPHIMIDLATLTGACVVALGEETAGAFGNDRDLLGKLQSAGKYYQEDIWELPITSEHEKSIKSKTADISNSGKSKYGGASQAAAFLKNFVEKDVKWAHLDIAGPAMIKTARSQFSAGGTAFGVQLLTKFITERCKADK